MVDIIYINEMTDFKEQTPEDIKQSLKTRIYRTFNPNDVQYKRPRFVQRIEEVPTNSIQLDESKESMDKYYSDNANLKSPSLPSNSSSTQFKNSKSLIPAKDSEEYASSPFSFIDKAIASPYTDEFIYLHPCGPYSLKIVEHNQIDKNHYFTMSRSGVTEFYGLSTWFTSLDQWEREYTLYSKMMRIPFFARFNEWKIFYAWKKYIRRNKMKRCQNVLQTHLYILSNHLRQPLLHLRNICYNASKWQVFAINKQSKKTLSLSMLQSHQASQQQKLQQQLSEMGQQCKVIVAKACKHELNTF